MDLPPTLEFSLLRNALPVINDSEALQYVGKAVEVRGLVFAVSISPSGRYLPISDENTPIRRSSGSLLAPKKA